jgi:predicted transcriptional regulator of viral defense system
MAFIDPDERRAVPRTLSAPFFSATPVFSRADYARAVGRLSSDKTVTTMLAQHVKAGNIKRLARGVYASVPKHADPTTWWVDRFLVGSRLRPGAVIGYHSALELHGCAYSAEFDVQVIASGEPGSFETAEFSCRFVRPAAPLGPDSVTTIDRVGQDVPVTTLERTVADVFDRPDLAGGAEELLNSLDLIVRLDGDALAQHLAANDNATAAGAAGWWLERRREALRVPGSALEAIHALAPRQTRYALGATAGQGRSAAGWNVVLPEVVANPGFEGI